MSEGGRAAIQVDDDVVAARRLRELESRIRDLERLLGRKTMEVGILREALSATRGKSPPGSCRRYYQVVPGEARGRHSRCGTFQPIEQFRSSAKPRGGYQRQGDDALLAAIRQITDTRPTYGYRRIIALLNRARRASGAEPLNHKRVYRLMLRGQLLLQRHGTQRPIRAHEGRVMAPASNLRWSSDGL